MDAYCKLEFWGIQIYAAIDQYSRCIMWLYAGISGRTAISVLAQYINLLADSKTMPLYLRSDRGAETTMAADAHYSITQMLREINDFSECFKFGTSKQNQRIESWWGQVAKAALSRWREFFEELSRSGEYEKNQAVDRIAFLAVYMPIIRVAVAEFVSLWNRHPMRKQSNRPYTVSGIPAILYNYPEKTGAQQQGISVLPEVLEPFQRDLEGFDIDEYLPPATLNWCNEQLSQQFPSSTIDGTTTDANGQRLHYQAYIYLRGVVAQHMLIGEEPLLSECDKPYGARDWRPVAPEVAQINNEGDGSGPNHEYDQWLAEALNNGLFD